MLLLFLTVPHGTAADDDDDDDDDDEAVVQIVTPQLELTPASAIEDLFALMARLEGPEAICPLARRRR